MKDFDPTPQGAQLASQNEELSKWVRDLLEFEGNMQLSRSFSEHTPVAVELYDFPLVKLKKIEGPEEDAATRKSPDIWDREVNELAAKIQKGYIPPPLIVTDYWNYFEIADGNHRHEALERLGYQSYWTIFLIKHDKGLEYFKNILNPKL